MKENWYIHVRNLAKKSLNFSEQRLTLTYMYKTKKLILNQKADKDIRIIHK